MIHISTLLKLLAPEPEDVFVFDEFIVAVVNQDYLKRRKYVLSITELLICIVALTDLNWDKNTLLSSELRLLVQS